MTEIASNRFAGFVDCPVERPCELSAFAWPGGYEIFYTDNTGETICYKCAQKLVDDYVALAGELWKGANEFQMNDHNPRIIGWSHTGNQDSCETCADCYRVIDVCGFEDEGGHSEYCNLREESTTHA